MRVALKSDFSSENLVLLVKKNVLNSSIKKLDSHGRISKIIELQGFKAKKGEVLHISSIENFTNLWLVGIDETSNFISIGAQVLRLFLGKNIKDVDLWIEDDSFASDFLAGLLLRDYAYDAYRAIKDFEKNNVEIVNLVGSSISQDQVDYLISESECVKEVRSLINCPPNDLLPMVAAARLKKWLQPLGVNVKILSGQDLIGMGALLGVGKGSAAEPCVVVLEWLPDPASSSTTPNFTSTASCSISSMSFRPEVALVGKGLTYDSGGYSLKPSSSMETMKTDMSGGAVVAGILANAAKNNFPKNIVGIIGFVENMVSGDAMRPDDIVTSLSGKTIEVLNTDAEGRLVLADLLHFVQEKYSPKKIIDLATLTGAVIVSLGHVYAGLFSNNDDLVRELTKAGDLVFENLWRLPLHEDFDKAMNSDIADLKNVAASSVGAGSATAAAFLHRFIKDGTAWAHIDIAGVSHLVSEAFAAPKGATGFGVRLLSAWLKSKS